MQVGWKLEAVDLMDPKLICPATVKVFYRVLEMISNTISDCMWWSIAIRLRWLDRGF